MVLRLLYQPVRCADQEVTSRLFLLKSIEQMEVLDVKRQDEGVFTAEQFQGKSILSQALQVPVDRLAVHPETQHAWKQAQQGQDKGTAA